MCEFPRVKGNCSCTHYKQHYPTQKREEHDLKIY